MPRSLATTLLIALGLGLPGTTRASPTAVCASSQTSPWLGVSASRGRSGAVAVWSADQVQLSRRGGPGFAAVPLGPGQIVRAWVGAAGTLFVIRQPGASGPALLEVIVAGQSTATRALPTTEPILDLQGGGGWLVAMTRGELHATRDRGVTWHRSSFKPDYDQRLAVDAAGAVELLIADVNTCTSSDRLEALKHLTGRAGTALADRPYQRAGDPPLARWTPVGGRRVYAQSAEGLVVVSQGRSRLIWRAPVSPDPPSRWWPDVRIVPGPVNVASHGPRLLRLEGDRVSRLAELPEGVSIEAVDARGRVLGLREGNLVRWSPGRRFEALLPAPCTTAP